MTIERRTFLASAAILGGTALAGSWLGRGTADAQTNYPVSYSSKKWREILSPDAYSVLREEATERPYSSPLNDNKKSGLYSCAGCDNPVYSSETKFDSGTGWPSFWAPVSQQAVGTKTDTKLLYPRTEVHCANCGGHLGHIFNDGPPPTGKRHCINGVAMTFAPGSTQAS